MSISNNKSRNKAYNDQMTTYNKTELIDYKLSVDQLNLYKKENKPKDKVYQNNVKVVYHNPTNGNNKRDNYVNINVKDPKILIKNNIDTTTEYQAKTSLITNFRKNAHSIKDLQDHSRPNLSANHNQLHKSQGNINTKITNNLALNNNSRKRDIYLDTNNNNNIPEENMNIKPSNYSNKSNSIQRTDNNKVKNVSENYKIKKKSSPNYSLDFEKYKSQLLDRLALNKKQLNAYAYSSNNNILTTTNNNQINTVQTLTSSIQNTSLLDKPNDRLYSSSSKFNKKGTTDFVRKDIYKINK